MHFYQCTFREVKSGFICAGLRQQEDEVVSFLLRLSSNKSFMVASRQNKTGRAGGEVVEQKENKRSRGEGLA